MVLKLDLEPLRAALKAAPGDAVIVAKTDLDVLIERCDQLQRTLTNIGSQARTA